MFIVEACDVWELQNILMHHAASDHNLSDDSTWYDCVRVWCMV